MAADSLMQRNARSTTMDSSMDSRGVEVGSNTGAMAARHCGRKSVTISRL